MVSVPSSRAQFSRFPISTPKDAIRLTRKNRQLDPAYRPKLTRACLERTAEVLDKITDFSTHVSDDRLLRDISFARFCVNLTALRLYNSAITDWSGLADLPALTTLYTSDEAARDLRPLGTLTSLQHLTLRIQNPWPRFAGIENLSRLTHFEFHGNVLAVTSIPALPVVRTAEFHHGNGYNAPLRLILLDKRKEHDTDADSGASPRDWGDDKEMAISERAWFIRQINRRLTRILGKGWGAERESAASVHTGSHLFLHIRRQRDLDHLPAVVRTLRQLIASCLHPWHLDLMVEPLAEYERDLDEIERDDGKKEAFDPDREREEWEYRRKRELERREYLKRRYQHRLGEELGIKAAPEPPSSPAASPPEEAYAQGDDSGPAYDLGTDLRLYFTLTEACAVTYIRDRDITDRLRLKLEIWWSQAGSASVPFQRLILHEPGLLAARRHSGFFTPLRHRSACPRRRGGSR